MAGPLLSPARPLPPPTPAARALDAAYALARPILFRLDAERVHEVVLGLLRLAGRGPAAVAVARRLLGVDHPSLAVEAFGLRFANPLGVAAGLDKNGVAVAAWAALGFGHVEVGTVTPRAQPGNPRPRVFRLPRDHGLINRMGFPSQGADRVARTLDRLPRDLPIVVGGNVGKAAVTPLERAEEDYAHAAAALAPRVAYLAANLSSPNTPGLRTLQAPDQVARILAALRPVSADRPLLVKLAPDLDDSALAEVVAAARAGGAAGLIAVNTTTERAGLGLRSPAATEAGGLSGLPLRARARAVTERLVALGGADLPVVSVGGLMSAADVQERLAAGARLVQVYSGLVYAGPGLAARALRAPGPHR